MDNELLPPACLVFQPTATRVQDLFLYRKLLRFFGCTGTIIYIIVLVSAFVMVSTVWSLSCFLFFCSWCFPCPVICKTKDTCPRSLWIRRHFCGTVSHQKHVIKQPFNLNAQCHKDYLPMLPLKVMHGVMLLTWFCKLLTRVAIVSGGTCLK